MLDLHGCLSSAHFILFLPTMCVGRSVSGNPTSSGVHWRVPAQEQVTPLHCADQTRASHLLQGSSLTLNCSRLHLGCCGELHGQLCASCSLPDISLLNATEDSQSAAFVFLVPPQSRSGLTQGRYDHVLNEEAQCGVFQSSIILARPL